MKICNSISELNNTYSDIEILNKKVGFVPTMGALHKGHISLIRRAKKENDIVIVSIFVNPRQFNQKKDFNNYPIVPEKDINLLLEVNCDILFMPNYDNVFNNEGHTIVKLGNLNNILEGEHRPGHFQGVIDVVYRLFEIIKPTNSYFGKKDYQQLLVIRKMVKELKLPINIISCDIIREESGLAMSSRNSRLSNTQLEDALKIYKALKSLAIINTPLNIIEAKQQVSKIINTSIFLKTEYVEIVSLDNFTILNSSDLLQNCVVLVAVWSKDVRLIDNIEIY